MDPAPNQYFLNTTKRNSSHDLWLLAIMFDVHSARFPKKLKDLLSNVQYGNDVGTEEDLEESLANGADDTFESDIDFMTKVISGGLNKQKSTGQTTIPVVSTQVNRLGSPMKESTDLLKDWRKLSGIK
jgi:hypothetical protein